MRCDKQSVGLPRLLGMAGNIGLWRKREQLFTKPL